MGTLGILVATRDSLDHLLGIVNAAAKQGVEVVVFLTGEGVMVTQDPRFGELAGRARLGPVRGEVQGSGAQRRGAGPGFQGFRHPGPPRGNVGRMSPLCDVVTEV